MAKWRVECVVRDDGRPMLVVRRPERDEVRKASKHNCIEHWDGVGAPQFLDIAKYELVRWPHRFIYDDNRAAGKLCYSSVMRLNHRQFMKIFLARPILRIHPCAKRRGLLYVAFDRFQDHLRNRGEIYISKSSKWRRGTIVYTILEEFFGIKPSHPIVERFMLRLATWSKLHFRRRS